MGQKQIAGINMVLKLATIQIVRVSRPIQPAYAADERVALHVDLHTFPDAA